MEKLQDFIFIIFSVTRVSSKIYAGKRLKTQAGKPYHFHRPISHSDRLRNQVHNWLARPAPVLLFFEMKTRLSELWTNIRLLVNEHKYINKPHMAS